MAGEERERCPICGSYSRKQIFCSVRHVEALYNLSHIMQLPECRPCTHPWHNAAQPVLERKIDGKFSMKYGTSGGQIVNTVSDEVVPEDEPLFLIRARDNNALACLHSYLNICKKRGCNDLHLAGIQQTIDRFERFSIDHPERMKQPGVTRHLKLGDVAQPALVAQGTNFVIHATPMPSCTVCGKLMSYKCLNCGSTPECVVVPVDARSEYLRGMEDAAKIAEAINETVSHQKQMLYPLVGEAIRSRIAELKEEGDHA